MRLVSFTWESVLSGVITEYALPTPGTLSQGITVGPDGVLWFTKSGANTIGRITTAGTVTEYAVSTAGRECKP